MTCKKCKTTGRKWVLNVWGDHIPCRTLDELLIEVKEALEDGAEEMSIERKDEERQSEPSSATCGEEASDAR